MRRFLPHIVYWVLLIGLGIFFWQRFQNENQQIALLNQPTHEVIVVVDRVTRQIKSDIKRHVESYRIEQNIEFGRRVRMTDSLITASFADPIGSDSLLSRLWVLTDRNQDLEIFFQKILPSKNQPVSPPYYQNVLVQNDSLRRNLLRWEMLQYFAIQVGGNVDIRFDSYEPAASFTTICPRVGEPFEMDILLSTHSTSRNMAHVNVNGQDLAFDEDIAHFEQTFSSPGIYPLQVKAEYLRNWDNDSLISAQKTFYLHINR